MSQKSLRIDGIYHECPLDYMYNNSDQSTGIRMRDHFWSNVTSTSATSSAVVRIFGVAHPHPIATALIGETEKIVLQTF